MIVLVFRMDSAVSQSTAERQFLRNTTPKEIHQRFPNSGGKMAGVFWRELKKPAEMRAYYKAPPVGLEPTTRRLTAACSTN